MTDVVDIVAETLDTVEAHDEEGLEGAEATSQVHTPITKIRRAFTGRLQVGSRDAERLLEETLVRGPAPSPFPLL